MCWGSWGSRRRWGGGLGLTAGPPAWPRADSRPSWPPPLLRTLSMCPPGGGSPGRGARAGLRAWAWCPPSPQPLRWTTGSVGPAPALLGSDLASCHLFWSKGSRLPVSPLEVEAQRQAGRLTATGAPRDQASCAAVGRRGPRPGRPPGACWVSEGSPGSGSSRGGLLRAASWEASGPRGASRELGAVVCLSPLDVQCVGCWAGCLRLLAWDREVGD